MSDALLRSEQRPKSAIVVGAGVSGLVSACYLQKAGWKVQLLESGPEVGGKMSRVLGEGSDLSWDTGPTLITLPKFIQQVFRELGIVSPLNLLPLQRGSHLCFEGGKEILLPAPGPNLLQELDCSATIRKELTSVLGIASEVFQFAQKSLLGEEPPSLFQLGVRTMAAGLAFRHPSLASQSYEEFVRKRLSDKDWQEFFFHFASYVGQLPHCAASGLISIAHVEMNEPIVFPKGGVFEIAQALKSQAIALGVDLKMNCRVSSAISKKEGMAVGSAWEPGAQWRIETNLGEPLFCEELVVAADPHQSLIDWLKCEPLMRNWYSEIVSQELRPSESQFVILFERDEDSPLEHHTKIFPKSWLQSFRETVEQMRVPDDPCVYLVWPHATDKSISPAVLFLSAMAPQLDSGHSWSADQCQEYSDKVLALVRKRLGRSLSGRVIRTVSPMDLYRNTGSLRGGLYGAGPTTFRPGFFARQGVTKVPGLSFVGGGVHPGAGVPMVMMGARRVSQSLIQRKGA